MGSYEKICRDIGRREFLRRAGFGAAFLASSSIIGRAGAQGGSTKPVIVGLAQEPTVFNPLMPRIEVELGVHCALFDPLFSIDPQGNFFPVLAREVPTVENGGISPDGIRWRVHLRDDVKWHDGKPFTAKDVKFTLELHNNPNFRAGRRVGHDLVQNVQIVSDHELTWEMKEAFSPYQSILTWTFMVPEHALSGDKPNDAPFNTSPIGTGPFTFGTRVPGDHLQLNANSDYWSGAPAIKQLIFKYIPDVTVLYTQFQSGDIDILGLPGIPPERVAAAEKLSGRNTIKAGAVTIEGIYFNMERPQFKEKQVRQALYYALDKDTVMEAIYLGSAIPTESYIATQSYYHNARPCGRIDSGIGFGVPRRNPV